MKKAIWAGLFLMGFSLFAEAGTLLRWPLDYYANPAYSRWYDHNYNDYLVDVNGNQTGYCSGGGITPCPTRLYTGGTHAISDKHRGTDILGNISPTYIRAAAVGSLYYRFDTCDNNGFLGSTCGGGFGNHVRIQHPMDGVVTIYAHMLKGVAWGQSILCGSQVGLMGNSGSSTGNHLHLDLWTNTGGSTRLDPFAGSGNYVNASYWVNQNGAGTGKPSTACQ